MQTIPHLYLKTLISIETCMVVRNYKIPTDFVSPSSRYGSMSNINQINDHNLEVMGGDFAGSHRDRTATKDLKQETRNRKEDRKGKMKGEEMRKEKTESTKDLMA
jgi:hypothetical protein